MAKPWIVVVGGYLGAGKTTLILSAARLLSSQGLRAAVVLNDQGEDLVDTEFAHAGGFRASQVTGGCFCCRYPDLEGAIEMLADSYDVIFAEPVGSCTDLVATVIRPLLASPYRVAPLTVVVDPSRDNTGFLAENQIAEADIVCYSKCDIAAAPAGGRSVSGRSGQGVAEWLDELFCGALTPGANPLDLDYDRYTQAELELSWLDCRASVKLESALSAAALVGPLIDQLDARLNAVHIKVIDATPAGFVKAAIAGKGSEPQVDGDLMASPALQHDLLLNIRAFDDPAVLESVTRDHLPPGAGIQLRAFRPNPPVRPARTAGI